MKDHFDDAFLDGVEAMLGVLWVFLFFLCFVVLGV